MKRLRGPVLLLMASAITSGVFTVASRDGGMFTPESVPDLAVVGVGLVAVSLRLMALFVAAPLVVYGVVRLMVGSRATRGMRPGSP